MRKLPVKAEKDAVARLRQSEYNSCREVSLLLGCYIRQDATRIVQEDLFMQLLYGPGAAPPVPRSRARGMMPSRRRGSLTGFSRKRYNPPTDGDGVWKPVPEFFAVGIDRTTFPEVGVKDGVR